MTLHTTASKSSGGRNVTIPSEAKTYTNWYSFEGYTNIENAMSAAKEQIGKNDIIKKGSGGEFTDSSGRYWVAVGPKVLDANYPDTGKIYASDFKYGTKLDVVFKKNGKEYYLYCVVGDIKAHTYSNGIYQTGKPYPNSYNASIGEVGAADKSVIEFIGKGETTGLSDYCIDRIIVYS